jgi:hypothetical protein
MASSVSSTTAVCERLWGSTPMITDATRPVSLAIDTKPRSRVLIQATRSGVRPLVSQHRGRIPQGNTSIQNQPSNKGSRLLPQSTPEILRRQSHEPLRPTHKQPSDCSQLVGGTLLVSVLLYTDGVTEAGRGGEEFASRFYDTVAGLSA